MAGRGSGRKRTKQSDQDNDEDGPASKETSNLVFGYAPFDLWRRAFYGLMVYHWTKNYLGPCNGLWHESMSYNHAEWVYEKTAPRTSEAVMALRAVGIASALASIFNDTATIIFAILCGQHIFTSLIFFVNHDYLFFLLATLMACCCNSNKENKAGWIHALRGQIVVVYFFASLWKTDSNWLAGDCVREIFTSFQEQGAARGVPWKNLYAVFPGIFEFVGLSGLLLDFALFCVLMFLQPGHQFQSLAFMFHGFTGYTMSQRIGYSFPLAMVFSGILFKPMDEIQDDTLSHGKWLVEQTTIIKKGNHKTKKVHWWPLLFLLLQWLIPMRMPLVSHGEFKHTFEGYRWSWTMMLHSTRTLESPGLYFMTLSPKCGISKYPNPMAAQNPFLDVHSVSYEPSLAQAVRSASTASMFPRQMAKIANLVHKQFINPEACNIPMTMTSSYFISTNMGPYHRVIDPTVDLLEAYDAHAKQAWISKLWYAILDKSPKEFILRGAGSIDVPIDFDKEEKGTVLIVDRSACLQADPIRIHSNSFQIEFDSSSTIGFDLLLRGCSGADLVNNCKERTLRKGEGIQLPAVRTISIGIDPKVDLGKRCSETNQEDIVIKLTDVQTFQSPMNQQQPQRQP